MRKVAREELFRLVFESIVSSESPNIIWDEYNVRGKDEYDKLDVFRGEIKKISDEIIENALNLAKTRYDMRSKLDKLTKIELSNRELDIQRLSKNDATLRVKLAKKLEEIGVNLKKIENKDELSQLTKLSETSPIEDVLKTQTAKLNTLMDNIIKLKVDVALKNVNDQDSIAKLTDEMNDLIKSITISNHRIFLNESQRKFIKKYLLGLASYESEIIEFINTNMTNWNYDRIGRVEQTLLLESVYELLYEKVPYEIVVNENVEIAKIYGDEKTPEFINGVLANIIKAIKKGSMSSGFGGKN